jgi:hypothetical protein
VKGKSAARVGQRAWFLELGAAVPRVHPRPSRSDVRIAGYSEAAPPFGERARRHGLRAGRGAAEELVAELVS